MSIKATVNNIRQIGDAARESFIDREDFVKALELSMVAGLHAIVLGPPGTGKSAGLRFFAGATGLGFFKKLLNPDLPREELVGPIDPVALQKGNWRRVWLGVATCPLVFIDEIGKGSAQVTNLLLDTMEERVVSVADLEKDIPLHSLFAASNETITESPAVWNRFSIRLVVDKITDTRNFKRFIRDAWTAKSPPSVPIALEDLVELRTEVYRMATNAHENPQFERTLLKLFSGFNNVGSLTPSPRQWQNVILLACANALLEGRKAPASSDLSTAWFVLWDDIGEIEDIKAWVEETVGEEEKELETAKNVLDQMVRSLNDIAPDNLHDMGTLVFRAKALLRECQEKARVTGEQVWSDLTEDVEKFVKMIEDKGTSGLPTSF